MYTNSSSRVYRLSKSFLINTGVLQGDTLAPFLFIIVVDYILQQTDDSHGLKTHPENPEEDLPGLDWPMILCSLMRLTLLLQNIMTTYKLVHLRFD